MKKIISLALVLLLIFSIIIPSASASYASDDFHGTWAVDSNMSYERNQATMATVFGSQFNQTENTFTISTSGSFSYSFSYEYGVGTYKISEDSFVCNYLEHFGTDSTITMVTIGGINYLKQTFPDASYDPSTSSFISYDVYWKKNISLWDLVAEPIVDEPIITELYPIDYLSIQAFGPDANNYGDLFSAKYNGYWGIVDTDMNFLFPPISSSPINYCYAKHINIDIAYTGYNSYDFIDEIADMGFELEIGHGGTTALLVIMDDSGDIVTTSDYRKTIVSFADATFEKDVLTPVRAGYMEYSEYDSGYVAITSGKYAFCDTEGNLVTDFIYDDVRLFKDGLAPVCIDGLWGYIDANGQLVIDAEYEGVVGSIPNDCYDGMVVVKNSEGKYGAYNSKGELILPFIYDGGYSLDNGELFMCTDGKWSVVATDDISFVYSSASLSLYGEDIALDAYNINGNNYMKLRDIAAIMDGTQKQFDLIWNSEALSIEMISDSSYSYVGGELVKNPASADSALLTTNDMYKDGEAISLPAYNINDNNYFKLRDICELFDIALVWDDDTQTIIVDPDNSYED